MNWYMFIYYVDLLDISVFMTVLYMRGRSLLRRYILILGFFPAAAKSCPGFFRHGKILISPKILSLQDIPVHKVGKVILE